MYAPTVVRAARTQWKRWVATCRRTSRTPPLVPAHAADREVGLAGGKIAGFPRRWARPAGPVGEAGHGRLPGRRRAVASERLVPELAPPVAAGVDEVLELAVGDLVRVDPEGVDGHAAVGLEPRQVQLAHEPARDADHSGRRPLSVVQPVVEIVEEGARDQGLERSISRFLEPQVPAAERDAEAVERCDAERAPRRVGSRERAARDLGTRGDAAHVHEPGDARPHRREQRLVAQHRPDLLG